MEFPVNMYLFQLQGKIKLVLPEGNNGIIFNHLLDSLPKKYYLLTPM